MRNTWFIDIDGTIVKHKTNEDLDEQLMFLGKKQSVFPYGESDIDDIDLLDEKILPGVKDFWSEIPSEDIIILTTARELRHKWMTEQMLKIFDLRYDQIIFALGSNKRFLINDREPHKGEFITYPHILESAIALNDKAIALNVERNKGLVNKNWVFTHT
jgi:uncharacterized HAD superfamily protein